MNIANWLYAQGKSSPDLPALYIGSQPVLSYQQFAYMAYTYGKTLRDEYNCSVGDRIIIYASNRYEYLIAMYASLWIGAIIVPINYRLHPKELEWVIEDTNAKIILSDHGDIHTKIKTSKSLVELSLDQLNPSFLNSDVMDFDKPYIQKMDELAWLFYTSGTTGRPKGVMLTHENLIAMSLCTETDVLSLADTDNMYYAAPLSHGAGLYNFIAVRKGARHVMPTDGSFSAPELFELAAELKNICLFAAPTMLKRITESAKKENIYREGRCLSSKLSDFLCS